jgi:activator of HSP90 ATPase
MQQESVSRLLTRRAALAISALAAGGFALRAAHAEAADAAGTTGANGSGISHTAGAIHQEPEFAAVPARVYAALLDPRQFDRVVELSGVLQAMHLKSAGSRINAHAGGAFALFGGFITGRQLDLLPNQRIVQAWRAADWPAGVYSVVRFELHAHDAGCRMVFDQFGFPDEEAQSLAEGWQNNYWEPIRKLLAS